MKPERAGELAWLGLAVGVAVYDLTGPETMSSAFRRGQPLSGVLGAYTLAHLMGVLPPELDAFKVLISHARGSERA